MTLPAGVADRAGVLDQIVTLDTVQETLTDLVQPPAHTLWAQGAGVAARLIHNRSATSHGYRQLHASQNFGLIESGRWLSGNIAGAWRSVIEIVYQVVRDM